jgi:hypothetical protein
MKKFSDEEQKINSEIREVYNSGNCNRALEMSREFLIKFPNSLQAKYNYAVMSGDYSYDIRHSEEEKNKLLEVAKNAISALFNSPELADYPHKFQQSVKNEYYWFHELPEDQYKHGLIEISKAEGIASGHYSACVGASQMALNMITKGSIKQGEVWAEKSLHHFGEFERLSPTWYNINYFGAQSYACIGEYDKAIEVFKAMYAKQGSEIKMDEVEDFLKKLGSIRSLRNT